MRKRLRDYWFVSLALLSLVFGLALGFAGLALASTLAYAVGATVGFALSVRWLTLAIRRREFGSDALAVISIAATAVTNEWLAASIVSVMLATGRALETWAEGRARGQLEALLARAPQVAHLIGADDEVTDVPLSSVTVGARLLVRSGEVVPIDGTLQTEGTFDESALTGEPMPVWRREGESVSSGVLNSGALAHLVTTVTAGESTYSNLIRLVEKAQASSATGVRLANRWALWFVPFALALAAAAWIITGDSARAVAVIVAATPCPLILAVPVALIAGMSRAAASGTIIKGGAALEALARAEVVLLDKTGTLTHGGPEITKIVVQPTLATTKYEDELLALAASLEQASPHVVARAILAEAKSRGLRLVDATEVVEDHGVGLTGLVAGRHVRVGQPTGDLPGWALVGNALLVAIEVDGELQAIIGLDDPVREESRETVEAMRGLGVKSIELVSGDRRSTVEQVAASVGIDVIHPECTPEAKLRIVEKHMTSAKGAVIAVGDGINDAPALALATVGVALGARGATAASEAADVVIVEDSIGHLYRAMKISKLARSRALQAAGAGMSLAIAAMALGSVGLLSASEGAIAQEFIDAGAILWALVPARR